jgi:hypothetical protein
MAEYPVCPVFSHHDRNNDGQVQESEVYDYLSDRTEADMLFYECYGLHLNEVSGVSSDTLEQYRHALYMLRGSAIAEDYSYITYHFRDINAFRVKEPQPLRNPTEVQATKVFIDKETTFINNLINGIYHLSLVHYMDEVATYTWFASNDHMFRTNEENNLIELGSLCGKSREQVLTDLKNLRPLKDKYLKEALARAKEGDSKSVQYMIQKITTTFEKTDLFDPEEINLVRKTLSDAKSILDNPKVLAEHIQGFEKKVDHLINNADKYYVKRTRRITRYGLFEIYRVFEKGAPEKGAIVTFESTSAPDVILIINEMATIRVDGSEGGRLNNIIHTFINRNR